MLAHGSQGGRQLTKPAALAIAAGAFPGSLAGATFWKMSGGGNDFVVFDNRESWFPKGEPEIITAVCARGLGVGADAVLLLEPPMGAEADFRMVYYNADGSEAPMCGNGALCIARFACERGMAERGREIRFETGSGLYRADLFSDSSSHVRLSMREPQGIRARLPEIEARGYSHAGFADTGTPHLIALVDDLEQVDVAGEGRALRRHPLFEPQGLNVNFIAVLGPHELAIRTYERGVEAETLSCGTGAAAAAILTYLWGLSEPPVVVRPPGGIELTIGFESGLDGEFQALTLKGQATIVFRGELTCIEPEADDHSLWPARRYRLGAEPGADLSSSTTPEQRLEMMWPLAQEAWAVWGHPLPAYSRSEAPVRLHTLASLLER